MIPSVSGLDFIDVEPTEIRIGDEDINGGNRGRWLSSLPLGIMPACVPESWNCCRQQSPYSC